jgi:NitT/TauT family transport system permease protein
VAVNVLKRVGIFVAVLAGVCALYTGYRQLYLATGWTKPFVVDDITMPSLWSIVSALFDPVQADGQLLISLLFDAALFTAKEAVVGFVVGSLFGFALGAAIARFRMLQRGLMPYVVASQTIPILAIAPIVVVGLGSLSIAGWTPSGWERVSVIAAYLTFFPVAINTLRGLQSADARALDLMRTYAASRWTVLWKLRVPASLPYVFSVVVVAAEKAVVRRAPEVTA